jgi:ABC-type nitrate/sulfonate/bicarbonate transport system substrate-binding protein
VNNKSIIIGAIAVLLIGVLFLVIVPNSMGLFGLQKSQDSNKVVRIGWLSTFAESGYATEPLKNTNILLDNGLSGEFFAFGTGPAMVEAAIAKNIDVIIVGRAPAISLVSSDPSWKIIGKVGYFKTAVFARNGSGINNLIGLEGKRIGITFGSGPYTVIYKELESLGINPETDVKLINLKPTELVVALNTNQVDAISWGEPIISSVKSKKVGYEIYSVKDYAVVAVSKDIASNPNLKTSVLDSVRESILFFAQNKSVVSNWYAKDAQITPELAMGLERVDPNFDANKLSDVDLSFTLEDLNIIQERSDFEFENKIIRNKVDVSKAIN